MKGQTKAVLVSVVVLALALSSVGSITYSWFSDSEEFDINIGTTEIDVDCELSSDSSNVDNNTIVLEEGINDLTLTITNNSVIPVDYKISFTVPRYSAYSDPGYRDHEGEMSIDENGSFVLDKELRDALINGYLANNLNSIKVSFGNDNEQSLGTPQEKGLPQGTQTHLGQLPESGVYYVLKTDYSATYEGTLLPSHSTSIPITIDVGAEYTENSMLNPIVTVDSVQYNTSKVAQSQLSESSDGLLTSTFNMTDLGNCTELVFFNKDYSVTLDWQALSTPGLTSIKTTITALEDSISIEVVGYGDEPLTLNGHIDYEIAVGSSGVTSVASDSGPVSCFITSSSETTTVSFSDSASRTIHHIGLIGQEV